MNYGIERDVLGRGWRQGGWGREVFGIYWEGCREGGRRREGVVVNDKKI